MGGESLALDSTHEGTGRAGLVAAGSCCGRQAASLCAYRQRELKVRELCRPFVKWQSEQDRVDLSR